MLMFETPILFLVFNRPDLTKIVFERIREIKPKRLYIAADGPRETHAGEEEKCLETRKIFEKIDWDCEIKMLFRDKNIGLRTAVSQAIDWFFDNEEKGIVLEDDCLADISFFSFCEELLEYYKDDSRIMHISGDNFQNGITRGDGSYYFSKIMHCWGWASWRRAWKHYDTNLESFSEFKKQEKIKNVFENKLVQEFFVKNFQKVYDGNLSSWATVWAYSIYIQNGLCINPNTNLITNIGFGNEATHTKASVKYANMKIQEIENIIHPSLFVLPYKEADNFTFEHHFGIIKPDLKE